MLRRFHVRNKLTCDTVTQDTLHAISYNLTLRLDLECLKSVSNEVFCIACLICQVDKHSKIFLKNSLNQKDKLNGQDLLCISCSVTAVLQINV